MKLRRKCFTLIELLVIVAIIAILASMLLPTLNQARAVAKGISCTSQERQVLTGLFNYADSYNGFGPGNGNTNQFVLDSSLSSSNATLMHAQLLPFLSNNKEIFHCPSDNGGARFWRSMSLLGVNFGTSYGHTILKPPSESGAWNLTSSWSPYKLPLNTQLLGYKMTNPSRVAFLGDAGWCFSTVQYMVYQYHNRGYNVGFIDGHVANYRAELLGNDWNKGYYRTDW